MYVKKRSFVFYIILFSLIVSLCFHVKHNQSKRFHKKWHKYASLKLFNNKLLWEKIHSLPPSWMTEQIAKDFMEFSSGISKEMVDQTFAQIKKSITTSYIVRYRVIDGELYRYFPENEPISLVNNSTEKALKQLINLGKFQNADFLFSYLDGVPIEGTTDSYHITEEKKWQAPVLFSAKAKHVPYAILVPDWRSTSKWWFTDIKNIRAHSAKIPWNQKKNYALWRGSLTKNIRSRLCQISLEYQEYLDAKLNVQLEDPLAQEALEQQGLFGNRVSWEEFLACKYLPLVDGCCCAAPAFQWRLFSKCLTLKQESEEIQWFYGALQPYVHYVPIQNDLSNLIEQIQWAQTHDAECKQIANNAFIFAKENLMMEDIFLYFYLVLKQYISLQKLPLKKLKKETRSNPRWVNIHHRKKCRKNPNTHEQYINTSSPFRH